jgi:glyoxylase I family protein
MLVENTEVAKRFYMDVLGMADDHAMRNPKLPFGGTFLRAGSSQIHLMELPSVDPKVGRPEHGGRCVPVPFLPSGYAALSPFIADV